MIGPKKSKYEFNKEHQLTKQYNEIFLTMGGLLLSWKVEFFFLLFLLEGFMRSMRCKVATQDPRFTAYFSFSCPKGTISKFLHEPSPLGFIKISSQCCSANTMLSLFSLLHTQTVRHPSPYLFTSQLFTLPSSHLYRRDEKSLHGNFQSCKCSFSTLEILVLLTTRHISSFL